MALNSYQVVVGVPSDSSGNPDPTAQASVLKGGTESQQAAQAATLEAINGLPGVTGLHIQTVTYLGAKPPGVGSTLSPSTAGQFYN